MCKRTLATAHWKGFFEGVKKTIVLWKTSYRYRVILLALGLAPQAIATFRIVPDAPVKNFSLPRFGEQGYKIWDLRGEEGRYINSERIDVTYMSLRIFSGDACVALETQIESPMASLFIQLNQARSFHRLTVQGAHYKVEGKNWFWDGNKHKILVHEAVHVTFQQSLTDEMDF